MLPIGYVLADTYRITKLLGQGGMAYVYEVTHIRLPMRSAVKLITGSISNDPKFLQRFRQEAEILARLRHPHVVHVSDFNQTKEGQPYLVMELLEGEDLAQRLRRTGPMPLAEALPIFLQIGDALQAAHDQGVIHRDLKPANVFLLSKGAFPNYTKVLDFGIAKSIDALSAVRTKNAELLGTPAYMAPEQARGIPNAASVRSDQFALALVLYEMLAGRAAFYVPGEDLLQTLTRVLFDVPEPLPYPQIEPALRRALRKDPSARFASIRDFIGATGALELSVIRPLLAHTRPQEIITVPILQPEVVQDREPSQPSQCSSARWNAELGNDESTLKPVIALEEIPSEQAAPPISTGALPNSTAPKLVTGSLPTLSRPSITGQKIAAPRTSRWSRKVAATLLGIPLLATGGSALLAWRGLSDLFARAAGAPAVRSASPTASRAPHETPHESPSRAPSGELMLPQVPGTWPPSAEFAEREESDELESAQIGVDVWAALVPAGALAAVRSELTDLATLRISELPLSAAVSSLPVPRPPVPMPVPPLHQISRRGPHRGPPRSPHIVNPKQTSPAPATAARLLQVSSPGGLSEPQRKFILACMSLLPNRTPAPLSQQSIELTRSSGGRLMVTSDQLDHQDVGPLERCLSPMQDQMSVPSRAKITAAEDSSDKGEKK